MTGMEWTGDEIVKLMTGMEWTGDEIVADDWGWSGLGMDSGGTR